MKTLYHALVSLHPAGFRRQFGAEMEWIFEESGEPVQLIGDVAASLGRQWILRTKLWILGVAALGGVIPFALGLGVISWTTGSIGVWPVPHRHLPARTAAQFMNESPTLPFLMLTTVIALMFISGTMVFAITWFRYSQRRRRG